MDFQRKWNNRCILGESSEGSAGLDRWWKSLWNLNCPSKVKIFVWRFCKNALPTRSALRRRKINVDVACPFCGREEETSLHVLWKCKSVRRTWKDFLQDRWKTFKATLFNWSNNMDLVWILMDMVDHSDLTIIWVIAWLIWNQRNLLVMQNIEPNFSPIEAKARGWLEELSNVTVRPTTPPIQRRVHWSPPVAGYYKLNFDGAIETASKNGGIGTVIRNENGDFMAAMSDCLGGVACSDHVEAIAALKAVEVALDLGLKNVMLEGDSLRIIQP